MTNMRTVVDIHDDAAELEEALRCLNDAGLHPVLAGVDVHGDPFLAFGIDEGDTMRIGVETDHPQSRDVTYSHRTACVICGAWSPDQLARLRYPVVVVRRIETL